MAKGQAGKTGTSAAKKARRQSRKPSLPSTVREALGRAAEFVRANRSKRAFIISAASAGALVLALCAFFIISAATRPLAIVSYGLGEGGAQALRAVAASYAASSGTRLPRVVEAPPAARLSDYASRRGRADIVFFSPGRESASLSQDFAPIPQKLADAVSLSLRMPAETEKGMYALPLSVDHFELSYDKAAFSRLGLREPASVGDLEAAAAALRRAGLVPLAIAGKDDRSLLALASYLVAGPYGLGPYEALEAAIASGKDFTSLLDADLGGGKVPFSLRLALRPLTAWAKAGYLYPSWLQMGSKDVEDLAARGNAPIFLVFLSDHRRIDWQSLSAYGTVRFPLFPGREAASIVGPMYAAGIPSRGSRAGAALSFLSYATGDEGQRALTSASGTAPAVGAAPALDLEARNVRQWAIMSERILQGLGVDAFPTRAAAKSFADELRAYLTRETH